MPHTVSRLANRLTDRAVIVRILAISNGSRWFAAFDQAEKNRSVKKALLEKEGYYANSPLPPLVSAARREAVAWPQRECAGHLPWSCCWRSRSRPAPAAVDRPTSGDGIALAVKASANSRSKRVS